MTEILKEDGNRYFYLVFFCIILLISIVCTICIYYCVRHKRKYFFDAAGRKFIVSSGDYSNLVNKMMEIIQFDNKKELEDKVNKNSIGILQIRNELNQNLIHLCAFYGARDCLLYLIKFNLINANEKDVDQELPLTILINNHSENSKRNKDMFLWICSITDIYNTNKDGVKLLDFLNEWQRDLYNKYVKNRKSVLLKYPHPTDVRLELE